MTNHSKELTIIGKSAENSEDLKQRSSRYGRISEFFIRSEKASTFQIYEHITSFLRFRISMTQTNDPVFQSREILASILLLLILLPELLIYSGRFGAALIMYAIILIALSLISKFAKTKEIRNICQALLLLPIFRLVNFSIPVISARPLLPFVLIYTPMIIPVTLVIINQKLTNEQLGLSLKNIQYYIPMAVLIGLILGRGETFAIQIIPLISDLSLINVVKLAFVMIFFVGIVEEIMFRSILQTRLEKIFGLWGGLILSSLLFGLMNSGYGTIYQILYTFFAGFLIGYIFQKTSSLPLIALIHGFINIFAFGVIPFRM